jgi:hypothetical protein
MEHEQQRAIGHWINEHFPKAKGDPAQQEFRMVLNARLQSGQGLTAIERAVATIREYYPDFTPTHAEAPKPPVEIYSGIDPIHTRDRAVRYWIEFDGVKSEKTTEWAPLDARAEALRAVLGTCIVDRSDKDSGLLRSMIGR